MTDIRVERLADLLVNYSIKVKPGDWIVVNGNLETEPLVNEVVKYIYKAGGNASTLIGSGRIGETVYKYSSPEQLKWVSPISKMYIEKADATIGIIGGANTRTMSNIDPEKQMISGQARTEIMQTYMKRSAEGSLRWVATMFPTNAYAQEADMSLSDYEDFVYGTMFCDKENPVAEWNRIHDEQQKVVDWLQGRKEVSVKSATADLTLSIEGRTFINSDGTKNMPSGEVFTGPVEDSANGWIEFSYPAIQGGREVEGVRMEFENGKVVKATAEKNEIFLLSQLDIDDGARFLGEFAIGTNYGIKKFTKSILFDEKIGGSIHLAVGAGYPETGSVNKSAIHWDFICDMREDSEIRVDGDLLYKNGKFMI